MLGVRLKPEEEERLERHARDLGRPKSALVREWIIERLDRESTDARVRRAAAVIARSERERSRAWHTAIAEDVLRRLDEQDGGYDWGPEGPPA